MCILARNRNICKCSFITLFVIKPYCKSVAFELKVYISFILNEIVCQYKTIPRRSHKRFCPPTISLKQLSRYLNRLWLVILIVKLPRVTLIALKGGIGIVISYGSYLHWESVLVTTPISHHKFFTKHIYSPSLISFHSSYVIMLVCPYASSKAFSSRYFSYDVSISISSLNTQKPSPRQH